jgi:hypothetical protein
MKTRHAFFAVLMFSGLMAIVGVGAAGEGEAENTERLKTQKEQVMKLVLPILDRIDHYQALKDQQVHLEIECRRAKMEFDQATKTVEVDKIAIDEYEHGTYPSLVQAAKGEIALAEADLAKAKDRLGAPKRELGDPDNLPPDLMKQRDKLAVERAEFAVEQAKRRLVVLTKFTHLKETTEREAAVAKAESKALELKSKYDELQNQLAKLGRDVRDDPAPNRSELKILILLDKATTLQDENQLDEAQKGLDEAARIARELEAHHAEIRFRAVRDRIKNAIPGTRGSLPLFRPN